MPRKRAIPHALLYVPKESYALSWKSAHVVHVVHACIPGMQCARRGSRACTRCAWNAAGATPVAMQGTCRELTQGALPGMVSEYRGPALDHKIHHQIFDHDLDFLDGELAQHRVARSPARARGMRELVFNRTRRTLDLTRAIAPRNRRARSLSWKVTPSLGVTWIER